MKVSVNNQSLVIFFRSMATLFAAGVPLNRSLLLLSQQMEDRAMAKVCEQLCLQVESGHSFSAGMKRFPGVFRDFHTRLVHTGERSGKLEEILAKLAENEENRLATIRRVKSALTYPAIITVVCIVMLVLIPPYLLEGQFQLIRDSGIEPPALTRFLMMMASPTSIWVGGLGLGWLMFFLWQAYLRPSIRERFEEWLLSLPVVGKILQLLACNRFAQTVALQLEAGLLLTEALERAAQVSLNPVLRRSLKVEILREGGTVADCLEQAQFFPRTFVELAAVGEEAGQLDILMNWLASMYEAELEAALDALGALIEPVIMLVMGIIVGIMLVGTMLPMVQALNAL